MHGRLINSAMFSIIRLRLFNLIALSNTFLVFGDEYYEVFAVYIKMTSYMKKTTSGY
jgi:hypothetical protein